MNVHQLKKLIREVIQEVETDVESDIEDPKDNSGESEPISPADLRKKQFGTKGTVLSLSLGGMNKNNSKTLRDFIGMIAYEAGKRQLDIIHAELEKDGKIGMEMDTREIDKVEPKTNVPPAKTGPLPKGWKRTPPDAATWNAMSPEERSSFLVPNSHEEDWKAATDADVAKAKSKPSKITKDTPMYNFGREGKLPKDNELWTDNDWKTWERLNPIQKKQVRFNIPKYEPVD